MREKLERKRCGWNTAVSNKKCRLGQCLKKLKKNIVDPRCNLKRGIALHQTHHIKIFWTDCEMILELIIH